MAIIIVSRIEVQRIAEEVQGIVFTLEDLSKALVLPPLPLPLETPTLIGVSPKEIHDAGTRLRRLADDFRRHATEMKGALPPGEQEDLLPVPGPNLKNVCLSRALRAVRHYVSTYQQLAALTEENVSATEQVGAKGLRALADLLAKKGLRFTHQEQ